MNCCEMCGPTRAEIDHYGICEDCRAELNEMSPEEAIFNEETDLFEN